VPVDVQSPEPELRRIYRYPPVAEAVCEVRFVTEGDNDPTLAGRIREKLSNQYDGKAREQHLLRAVGQLDSSSGMQQLTPDNRIQLVSISGKQLLSIGHGVIAASDLEPYSGWETYRKQIEAATSAYVTFAQPAGVSRIGIRYINTIPVGESSVAAAQELLTMDISSPVGLHGVRRGYLNRAEFALDSSSTLIVTIGKALRADGGEGIVLDIDASRSYPAEALPLGDVMNVVDQLRGEERQAFEACITDKARMLFEEKE
jgi:uncharacterized protein (TIGR04255 family)